MSGRMRGDRQTGFFYNRRWWEFTSFTNSKKFTKQSNYWTTSALSNFVFGELSWWMTSGRMNRWEVVTTLWHWKWHLQVGGTRRWSDLTIRMVQITAFTSHRWANWSTSCRTHVHWAITNAQWKCIAQRRCALANLQLEWGWKFTTWSSLSQRCSARTDSGIRATEVFARLSVVTSETWWVEHILMTLWHLQLRTENQNGNLERNIRMEHQNGTSEMPTATIAFRHFYCVKTEMFV